VVEIAPPRLTPGHGFVDTMLLYSEVSYQAQSLGPFVNPYAAMPSLHVGWAYLIGIGVALVWRDWRGALTVTLLPALMSLAVVLTANHYILDGAFGVLVASFGLAAALWWERGRTLPLAWPGWGRRARTRTPETV
jgi:membrane-associated phospholipid phosphatase